jgi:hypothetical protein
MVLGLWSFANSLIPNSSPSGFFIFRMEYMTIDLSSLFGGALAFYAGMTMLRLNELGRQFVVVLLSIRVAINSLGILLWFASLKKIAGSALFYQGEQIYRIDNPYAYPIVLLIWIVFVLLIITFLTQRETKKLFAPEATDSVDPNNGNSDNVESDILI